MLDHPLMVEARDEIRLQLIERWETMHLTPVERETIWQSLRAHTRVWEYLTEIVTTGRLTDPELIARERGAAGEIPTV